MSLPTHAGCRPSHLPTAGCIFRVLAFLTLAVGARAAEPTWAPEEFESISGPASPRVAVAVRSEGGQLRVAVEAASFAADGSGVHVQLGLAADATVTLDERAAEVVRGARLTTCTFATHLAPLGDLR
ncbi:MAG: hypothetical protein H0X38_15635, partial [Planctomycetes bacterium]|nr:hypothetical protein [Planctomycetota bacterium]